MIRTEHVTRFLPATGQWNYRVYVNIRLRRVSDGLEVDVIDDTGYPADFHGDVSSPTFMWSRDGNYGCDCNRHLFFERALGNDPACGEHGCGDGEYVVVEPAFLSDEE